MKNKRSRYGDEHPEIQFDPASTRFAIEPDRGRVCRPEFSGDVNFFLVVRVGYAVDVGDVVQFGVDFDDTRQTPPPVASPRIVSE